LKSILSLHPQKREKVSEEPGGGERRISKILQKTEEKLKYGRIESQTIWWPNKGKMRTMVKIGGWEGYFGKKGRVNEVQHSQRSLTRNTNNRDGPSIT